MRIFSRLYQRLLSWAAKPSAPCYLAGVSFAEASFFPLPPDIMLIPMVLAHPQKSWHYAGLATLCSVLGGLLGYTLGYLLIDLILPVLVHIGYGPAYHQAVHWFTLWGFWAMLVAGFSPVPYKLFTIAAGAMGMLVAPFVFAAALGRAGRFFLVAAVMRWGGKRLEPLLARYIDWLGWLTVIIAVAGYLALSI